MSESQRRKGSTRQLITRRELARRLGIDHRSVYRAVEAGRVRTYGPRRMVDAASAEREYLDTRDTSRGRPSHADYVDQRASSSPPAEQPPPAMVPGRRVTFADARARQLYYQAELKRIEYEQAAGQLLQAREVESAAYLAARRACDLLVSLNDRLAPMLSPDAATRLKEEIRHICADLSIDADSE